MIKGGRKAKLNAIENQSKLRIEKLFMALNKESLNKLRAKIMPESLTTPIALLNEENEFNDAIKNSPNNKATHNLSKTVGRKTLTKSKLVKNQADTEALKSKFIQLFTEEMDSRKRSYFVAKEKKDEVFREIEHLKTSLRLIENKTKKKMNVKAGGYFPLKIEVCLANANLSKNKDFVIGKDIEEDLEVYYKMDNGKDLFKSDSCKNILNPSWKNTFSVTLENIQERLYFQLFIISDCCFHNYPYSNLIREICVHNDFIAIFQKIIVNTFK